MPTSRPVTRGHGGELATILAQFVAHEEIPPKVLALRNNLGLSPHSALPTRRVGMPPFQFYSSVNSNPSYIHAPRLSATKLLTDTWCELREFYEVYAGSQYSPPSEPMLRGTKHHLQLEAATHDLIDVAPLLEAILSACDTSQAVFAHQALALEWADQLVRRTHELLTQSEAREVLVHAYVDESGYCAPTPGLVLVSGIVDQMVLQDGNNSLDMFEEIQHACDVADVGRFVEQAPAVYAKYPEYELVITDVKTRLYNNVPAQASVVNGARLQVFQYRRMVHEMIHNGDEMLVENARRRGVDVDAPLSGGDVLMLWAAFPLLRGDLARMAGGEQMSGLEIKHPSTLSFITEDTSAALQAALEPWGVALEDIPRHWAGFPTMRYLARRSSQLVSLLGNFRMDRVSVEYHNSRTGRHFHTNEYRYDEKVLDDYVKNSMAFWTGHRDPVPTADAKKCNYCDFRLVCSVPNQQWLLEGWTVGQWMRLFSEGDPGDQPSDQPQPEAEDK